MAERNLLHEVQAQAQAWYGLQGAGVGRAVVALEDARLRLGGDADAMVAHPHAQPSRLPLQRQADLAALGEDLKKAYTWVSTNGKALGGYTAITATQELKKITDAEAAARREYERAKDEARKQASNVANAANDAFKAAGNAFKGLGKKHHHHSPPDPKFHASVFDWDYYYDAAPDVVRAKVDLATHWRDNGFREGRRGAREFSASYYLKRYTDVQALCHGDLQCALQHWVDHGSDEGRNGSPVSSYAGPVSGPVEAGGGGGDYWTDINECHGGHVTGFRIRAGKFVDGLQFRYGSRWGNTHGYSGGTPLADVTLAADEYIVRVDFHSGNLLDSISFTTNRRRTFGPYGGGGGGPGSYIVTSGEKLGCLSGRAGNSIDHLTLRSTGHW